MKTNWIALTLVTAALTWSTFLVTNIFAAS